MKKNRKLSEVKLGIIGLGNMGSSHARNVLGGKVPRCTLAAACDCDAAKLKPFEEKTKTYLNAGEMIASGDVNAVLVATPHYDHTTLGIEALEAGLHVLVEKPISVHKEDAQKLIEAHKGRKQVFAAMFNQRTDPHYSKVKDLIERGELGRLIRVTWIITSWYRTEEYYASGGWRATWGGEGGGVLLNQCPHQLDMLQWLCGMPARVQAHCHLGKWHDIEVEDDVTAYLEFPNGATGVFISTTGESPGTNRLEISGEYGKVVVENGTVKFTRNLESCLEFSKKSDKAFGGIEKWNIDIPAPNGGGQHVEVLNNFVAAILDETKLIAPAKEGINSVELGNAMLLSSQTGKAVDLPIDPRKYARLLRKLIREAKGDKQKSKKKQRASKSAVDMAASFNS